MGELTVFQCRKCGYQTEQIRWGVGQTDPRIRLLPGLCSKCSEIIEVDLTDRDVLIDKFIHEKCGSEVLFFQRGDSFSCPKCGEPDLLILQKGYW